MSPFKAVFLCAGEIGYRALTAVKAADICEIPGVFTYEVEAPWEGYTAKIQQFCHAQNIPFFLDKRVDRSAYRAFWEACQPDAIFAIKWRTIVPKVIRDKSRLGLIIFHASLLPKYRGFAPINWVLINGEKETGVTMFYGEDDVDTGNIIDQRKISLSLEDTAKTLDTKVTETVVAMLLDNIPKLAQGTAPSIPQNHQEATHAIWRRPSDGHIPWDQSTMTCYNLIRGLTYPYPGAFSYIRGKKCTIWEARLIHPQPKYVGRIPGRVAKIVPGEGVYVLTGDGVLLLTVMQREGEEKKAAWEVITSLKTQLE